MSREKLNNIVITGAGSGLGEALAKIFSGKGNTLGLIGRNRERLERVAGECRNLGARVETASIDVRDRDELAKWLEDFDNRFPVDLVIANAGIIATGEPASGTGSGTSIRETFDTNFFGVINTVNPLLERMSARKNGNIAIISSLSAYLGVPLYPAYSASKAALKSYYEGIRGIYARNRVWISVICPSFISTPMNAGHYSPFKRMTAEEAAHIIKKGLERHRANITFPISHLWGIRLLKLLPDRMADRIFLRIFKC